MLASSGLVFGGLNRAYRMQIINWSAVASALLTLNKSGAALSTEIAANPPTFPITGAHKQIQTKPSDGQRSLDTHRSSK